MHFKAIFKDNCKRKGEVPKCNALLPFNEDITGGYIYQNKTHPCSISNRSPGGQLVPEKMALTMAFKLKA